jgi:hypothetical protein
MPLPKLVDFAPVPEPSSGFAAASNPAIHPQVRVCTQLSGANCPNVGTYCGDVPARQWNRNNHDACTAFKARARQANAGCATNRPCRPG